MAQASPAEVPEQRSQAPITSDTVRRVVLSGTRIKLAVSAVTLALVAVLSGTMVVCVDRIFDSLTPVARKDLTWKTVRGVAELSRTTDLGLLLRDRALLQQAAKDYENDAEVLLLSFVDAHGKSIYRHAKAELSDAVMFRGEPRQLHATHDHLSSWTHVELEGVRLGKLGLVVSTARLRAGEELRRQVLRVSLGAAGLAILLSLVFVSFYVSPLIAVTKRAFLELEKKTVEALEATRMKSEFLANMSHELRTPLSGIIGMLGLLVRGDLSERQRRQAEISEASARSLLALVNDILDFSRMEAGHHVLHIVDCELHALVQNRIELLAVKAHAKQLEIAYHVAPDVPQHVRVDAERLTQVLTNLVGNAVKFTQAGEVVVSVTRLPDTGERDVATLRFEVRDTGPGIAAEHHARLFKSFSQLEASSTREHEGTGLGLAISKRLVESMGGEIGVRSERGRGATFWFTVRCQVLQRAQAKPVRVMELHDCLTAQATPASGRPRARRAPPQGDARRGHILVVDDNEVNRVLADEMLRELGHTCDLAASGREALDQTAARDYDAILMDCQMPGMNGYQVTHQIREREARAERRTPIIALTAHALGSEREKVRAAGMDDFITKPVTPLALENVLQKWMQVGAAATSQPAQLGASSKPANDAQLAPPDPAHGQPVLADVPRSARVLETFLRVVPGDVERLVRAGHGDDLEELRARAHRLRGSAVSVGAMRIAKLCEAIEHAAEPRERALVAVWAERVAEEFVEVRRQLEAQVQAKRAGA